MRTQVDALLKKMTHAEKIGQLNQLFVFPKTLTEHQPPLGSPRRHRKYQKYNFAPSWNLRDKLCVDPRMRPNVWLVKTAVGISAEG